VKFLKTIFYQLDETKVLKFMDAQLQDPRKSDRTLYRELVENMGSLKKWMAPLYELFSLRVLKQGMGRQAAELLKPFLPARFHNYLEIYDRRYCDVIRKHAKAPLDGQVSAASNSADVKLVDRIQAGALFSRYPYATHVPLNDAGCADPFLQPERTHRPIGRQVPDRSVDLIGCLGGLHHIPPKRVDPFVASLSRKLKAGGVILMRDHNVAERSGPAKLRARDLAAIVSLVHTFVNAANGVSEKVERREVREFKSLRSWTQVMNRHGFAPVSKKHLVLKDDPTENGMMAFVKLPQNGKELRQAIEYRNDCTRSPEGTYATWMEWGNVRSSKQFAAFIQNHHAYAFDYLGHIGQHWTHFIHYIQETRARGISIRDMVFCDNFAMNLFILFSATIQYGIGSITNLPAQLVAKWKYGAQWREVAHLTPLEKYAAQVENEYSTFIDHTPFYMFDNMKTIKGLWGVVVHSPEGFFSKISSVASAVLWSVSLLAQSAVSAPVRAVYTAEMNREPETVKLLIKDPKRELNRLSARWEREKDPVHEKQMKIEEIMRTPDGYALVSVPRYRPFTRICSYLTRTSDLELLEVGSQKTISVDVRLTGKTPKIKGCRVAYETECLQDPQGRRIVTYVMDVSKLKEFQQKIGIKKIDYIHE
jgi:hypothetical protein